MTEFSRPYLDAVAWTHAISGNDEGVANVRPILEAADEGKIMLIMSARMPVEVLGGGHDERTTETEQRALDALQRPNVIEVPVNRSIVSRARELRLELHLKSMDALHLASAVRGRADAFFTNDDKVLAVGSLDGMVIEKPRGYGEPRMFDQVADVPDEED